MLKLENLDADSFEVIISFADTCSFLTLLNVCKSLNQKCKKYKKLRTPFVVIESLYTYGFELLSDECLELLTKENVVWKENFYPKLCEDDNVKITRTVLKLGLAKSSITPSWPLKLFTCPYRFRKCLKLKFQTTRYEGLYYDQDLYIKNCLEKCRDSELDKSYLFDKIMRKYKKSKSSYNLKYMLQFNEYLIKKFI